jgi:hypothetical protein
MLELLFMITIRSNLLNNENKNAFILRNGRIFLLKMTLILRIFPQISQIFPQIFAEQESKRKSMKICGKKEIDNPLFTY